MIGGDFIYHSCECNACIAGDVGEHVTGSLLGPESSSSQSMPPDQDCLTLQSRFGLMVGDDMTNGGHGGGGRGGGAQHVVKVNNRSSWSFSTKAGGGSQSPCPHSNSTDFGDRSNSMFSFASSKGKNPLDHPDDDIQYMDIDGAELGIRFVSCPVPMHGMGDNLGRCQDDVQQLMCECECHANGMCLGDSWLWCWWGVFCDVCRSAWM